MDFGLFTCSQHLNFDSLPVALSVSQLPHPFIWFHGLLVQVERPEWFLFLGQIHHLPSEILSLLLLQRLMCSLFPVEVIPSHSHLQLPVTLESLSIRHGLKDTDINFSFSTCQRLSRRLFFFFLSVWCKKYNILFISWDFESYRINSNASLMTF